MPLRRLAASVRAAAARRMGSPRSALAAELTGPGPHAARIAAHFGGRVAFDGERAEFAQPLTLLAFTNRSGSTLLGQTLRKHPGFRGFGESLNGEDVVRRSREDGAATFPDYLRLIASRGHRAATTSLGLKASLDQMAMLLRWRIDRMFPGLRVIHITRGDVLGQAISLRIATRTGQWSSGHAATPGAEPVYDFEGLCATIEAIGRANAGIRLLVEAAGLPCHPVTYEALVADPEATVRGIEGWAGLPDRAAPLPPPALERQASAVSREHRERFLEDLRLRGGVVRR